jgi:hypothetical protein
VSGEPRPLRRRQIEAVILAVVLGLLFRFAQWSHGLPEFLEEAWPFRQAWAMWGWDGGAIDLNPHRFHYPSLTFYLHFLLQQAQFGLGSLAGIWQSRADLFVDYQSDPGALVIAARVMGTVVEVAGIAAVAWMGERIRPFAGLAAAAMLALSLAMIHAVRAIVPDTYMTALSVFALLAMLTYLRDGRRGALIAAIVTIGLATGAKYPAATLLLPLGAVLAMRRGMRALLLWPLAAAGALAVFLITTPYAVLDLQTFVRDLGFVRQLPGAGHLGRLEGSGAAFNFGTLLQNIGIVGLVLRPVSLVLTVLHRRTRRDEIILWIALVALALPVFTARVEAERYMVPILSVAALLAAAALVDLAARAPGRWRRGIQTIAPLLLVIPLIGPAVHAAFESSGSTRVLAARWFEAHAGPSDLIVQEAYGAPLHTRLRALEMRAHPLFQAAGEDARKRYIARPVFRAVQLPLTTVGPGTVIVPDATGREVSVPLASHSVEYNHLSYEPRLFGSVEYIVVTNAVRGRFMADTSRFAAEAAFYGLLERTAKVAAAIVPGDGAEGPEITIYHADGAFRDSVRAMGPLDPLWWAGTLPLQGRRALETAALPSEARTAGAVRGPEGGPAPWVMLLDRMYGGLIRPFTHPMSAYLTELGRHSAARTFAVATLEVLPADIEACLVYTTACAADGLWEDARRGSERTIAVFARGGEPPAVLQIEYARILSKTGDTPLAREILESLASRSDPATAAQAREAIAELGR